MNSISSEIPPMMVPLSSAPIDLLPLLNADNNNKIKKNKSKNKNGQQSMPPTNQPRNPSSKSESSSTNEIREDFKQLKINENQKKMPQMKENQKKSFQNCHTVFSGPLQKSLPKEQNFQKRDNQNYNSKVKVRKMNSTFNIFYQ